MRSSTTPHSLSPASTRPSSVTSGKLDGDLDELVDQVSLRAQLIAQAHKKKLASQPMSRSFGDISELEATDDAARRIAHLQQCKFASECGLHSVYPEVEGSAHDVMRKMTTLIQESKKLQRRNGVGVADEEGEEQWEGLDVNMSLSEPNLASEDSREDVGSDGE